MTSVIAIMTLAYLGLGSVIANLFFRRALSDGGPDDSFDYFVLGYFALLWPAIVVLGVVWRLLMLLGAFGSFVVRTLGMAS